MNLKETDIISCIDFETTGTSRGNIPVELGIYRMNGKGEFIDYWECLFDCGVREKTKASLRFLSDDQFNSSEIKQMKSGQLKPLREHWEDLDKILTPTIICAHNLAFDKNVLVNTFPFFKPIEYMDSLTIFRNIYKNTIDDYSLSNLLNIFRLEKSVAELNLNKHFTAHRALYDAVGCAFLIKYLLENPQTKSFFSRPEQKNLW